MLVYGKKNCAMSVTKNNQRRSKLLSLKFRFISTAVGHELLRINCKYLNYYRIFAVVIIFRVFEKLPL